MAKKDFKPLGGSSRNYVNTKTGEIISRYKYDKLYGATQEFKGNTHLKAKLNRQAAPEIAAARPAPGRKSTLKEVEKTRGSRIRPLKGAKYRHISIPVKYKNGAIDAANLELRYTALVNGLKLNTAVYGSSINITFILHGLIDTKNIFTLKSRRSIPNWAEFLDAINNYYLDPVNYKVSGESLADLKILAFDFYIVFTAAEMKRQASK
jgi:hypothetical protein